MFVVIIHDMCLRTVKVRSSSGSIHEYVRVVEAYRDNGKVKQRTLADLGRKDLLVEILPKLQRFLGGDRADTAEAEDPDILDTSTWGPVLVVRTLFDQLGLWTILDAALGKAKWSVSQITSWLPCPPPYAAEAAKKCGDARFSQSSMSCRVNFHANGLGVRLLSSSYNAKRTRTASSVAKSFGVSTFLWMIEK